MEHKQRYSRHYEKNAVIKANAEKIFAYADDHNNFSSHMNKPSWMMGGGKMETKTDEGKGQKVGSHIRMAGKVFGVNLMLDEVIIEHDPPHRKTWQTVGELSLLVIDHYALGFEIKPHGENSMLKVYIDYDPPKSDRTQWLGLLFGEMYAKWCVKQMVNGVKNHFDS